MGTGQTGTNFSPTVPHFFTIIVEKTLRNNKVQIPKKIVKKCGGSLTEEVLLKLPCGLDWKIGLTKSDGKVWIDKGWPEFSKHYSIAFGHFLVFRYEGNSQFQVAIFDKSTIEIDYCSVNKKVKEEPKDDETMDTNSRPCPETTEKPQSPSSRPRKRVRRTSSSHQSHDLTPEGELNLHDKQSENEKSIPARRLSAKEKAEAINKRAIGFKSNQPFFVLLMQPSHVQAKCTLNVPRGFAKSYLGTGIKYVTLKALNGRNTTWSVKYNNKGFDCKNSKPKFGAGWRKFVRDKGLKRGDVCVFEMTKRTGSITFEVSLYRENGNANSASMLGVGLRETKTVTAKSNVKIRRTRMHLPMKSTAKEEPVEHDGKFKVLESEENTSCDVNRISKASEAANNFCSKNPFFQVDFPSSHLDKDYLSLPGSFGRSYLEPKTQLVILQVGERSWPVNLLYGYPVTFRFSRGWSVFATENSLRPRDTCIFELIKKNQAVFEVSIFSDQI